MALTNPIMMHRARAGAMDPEAKYRRLQMLIEAQAAQLTALRERLTVLEQKRGPGRPPKVVDDAA